MCRIKININCVLVITLLYLDVFLKQFLNNLKQFSTLNSLGKNNI